MCPINGIIQVIGGSGDHRMQKDKSWHDAVLVDDERDDDGGVIFNNQECEILIYYVYDVNNKKVQETITEAI